jgi:hypothetical protein
MWKRDARQGTTAPFRERESQSATAVTPGRPETVSAAAGEAGFGLTLQDCAFAGEPMKLRLAPSAKGRPKTAWRRTEFEQDVSIPFKSP